MMSLTPVGLAMYNRQNQHLAINEEIPGFNTLPYDIRNTHITGIIQRPNGEIWLGSESYGILALRGNQATVYDKSNSKFIKTMLSIHSLQPERERCLLARTTILTIFCHQVKPATSICTPMSMASAMTTRETSGLPPATGASAA